MTWTVKYELYQVKPDLTRDYGFMGLDMWETVYGTKDIDMSLYDKVYEGEILNEPVYSNILVQLFRTFNIEHPEDFTGRSMSVSDIVKLDNVYWYCDSVGFTKINPTISDSISKSDDRNELKMLFKRVNELTRKYPNMSLDELRQLRELANGLSGECNELIFNATEVVERYKTHVRTSKYVLHPFKWFKEEGLNENDVRVIQDECRRIFIDSSLAN